MKGFISYARKDKDYFDLIVDGIKSHSAGKKIIEWELWSDNAIEIGADWHQTIQSKLEECEFAILLLSANFFASAYIRNHEFPEFIRRKKEEGFLIFPILISTFDYSSFEEAARLQFFHAPGEEYDIPRKEGETVPYDMLVTWGPDRRPLPSSTREEYHMNLVKAIEKAIYSHNQKVHSPYNDARIRAQYGIAPGHRKLTPLEEELQRLDVRSPIIRDLHRVNCDRVNLIGEFWRFFEQNKSLPRQFYVIVADSLHQPESFAERLVYELDEDLTEKGYSIYFKSEPLLGVVKHKVSLQLERKAKRDFRTGFAKMASPEQGHTLIIENLEDFATSDSPALQHDYIALIFKFDAHLYPTDYSFKKYLEWIRDDFCKVGNPGAKFLFFLVFSIPHRLKQEKKDRFYKTLKKFAAKRRQDTLLLRNFSMVKIGDLVRWFSGHLATDFEAEEIVEKIINYLDENFSLETRERFFNREDEAFQMAFIQKVLNDVCNLHK